MISHKHCSSFLNSLVPSTRLGQRKIILFGLLDPEAETIHPISWCSSEVVRGDSGDGGDDDGGDGGDGDGMMMMMMMM